MIQHLVADGGICVVLYTLQHPIKSACGADRQMLPNSVAETNTFMGFFGIQLSREFQNATHGKWYSKVRIIHMTVVRRENLKDHFGHHIVYSVELCSECWSPISMYMLIMYIIPNFLLLVFLQENPHALRDATAGVNFEVNNVRRRCPMLTTSKSLNDKIRGFIHVSVRAPSTETAASSVGGSVP